MIALVELERLRSTLTVTKVNLDFKIGQAVRLNISPEGIRAIKSAVEKIEIAIQFVDGRIFDERGYKSTGTDKEL